MPAFFYLYNHTIHSYCFSYQCGLIYGFFSQLHAEALIYVSCRLQVGDVPHKRKKGVFGTKGGDKEVSFSTLRFLSKRLRLLYKSSLHFIVFFFFITLSMFFAVLWGRGRNFSKILLMATMH